MDNNSLLEDVRILRKEGFINGDSLSTGLIKEFGTDFFSQNDTEVELAIAKKPADAAKDF